MSNNHDDTINDNDDDEQQHLQLQQPQQPVKTKIIKCKTNNQQIQTSSYNILTPNGSSSSTTIRSIDVPNEHTSIKLHIRRVCSPSSNDSSTINPLSQQSNDLNDQQSTTKIISRQFFNSNELLNNKISRRLIPTRRRSLIETDQCHISSSIYDLPKPIINNHINIYDENTLKKSTTKLNENKRKLSNEKQDKKRTKLTSRAIKQTINNNSRLKFYL